MIAEFDPSKYDELRAAVLKRIPDAFTVNDNVIEMQTYDATLIPININPHRMGGRYYPTFYEYSPRTFEGQAPVYQLTRGEETTIDMWYAMLFYNEYDLLADLFILGFINDDYMRLGRKRRECIDRTISGCLYTADEIESMSKTAKKVLSDNGYGEHNPRCKTYLTLHNSKAFRKYRSAAWSGELQVRNAEEFAQIMMEIIVGAYEELHFIIKRPSDESIKFAQNKHQQAVDRYFDFIQNYINKEGK